MKKGFSGAGSYGEVIMDQCQLKPKGNQDVCSITEVAVLEFNESVKIRELYRAIGEIPETERWRLENEAGNRKEWEDMGGNSRSE